MLPKHEEPSYIASLTSHSSATLFVDELRLLADIATLFADKPCLLADSIHLKDISNFQNSFISIHNNSKVMVLSVQFRNIKLG